MKLSFMFGSTVEDFLKVCIKNKSSISLVRIHRVILHLFFAIPNSIGAILDRIFAKHTPAIAPVFILGHYRSGTTHLQNVLNVDGALKSPTTVQALYPRLFYICEPILNIVFNLMTPGKRTMDEVAMIASSPQEEEMAIAAMGGTSPYLAVHFPKSSEEYERFISFKKAGRKDVESFKEEHQWFSSKLQAKLGASQTLLFKSPANTARVKVLLEAYPDAKFVYIHREPYRTIRSTLHLYGAWYEMSNFSSLEKAKKEKTQNALNAYSTIMKDYLEDKKLIDSSRLVEVSFEELYKAPHETVTKIYEKLGLGKPNKAMLSEYLGDVSSYKQNKFKNMDKVLIKKINQQCEFVFKEYDYPMINDEVEE